MNKTTNTAELASPVMQKGKETMQKTKKKQDDRLLKRLTRPERQQQERLRSQILNDPVFKTV